MRRVIRRALGVGVVALLLATGVADAVAPDGPRLAVIKLTPKQTQLELLTVGPDGALRMRLAGGGRDSRPLPYPITPPSWRPDGGELAFTGIVGRIGSEEIPRLAIFLASADGSGVRRVPKTLNGEWPVFAPDGHTIAFTRYRRRPHEVVNGKVTQRGFISAAIWILDLDTGASRRLTPWRNGLEYFASSFSSDGSILLATRHDYRPAGKFEAVAVNVTSGSFSRLRVDGLFPVYSPDGSEIALFREVGDRGNSDLYVLDAASGALRRLTRTPRFFDGFASWDPSGERIAFARFPRGLFELPSSIIQINADGTCPIKTLSAPRTGFLVPAWQPGPGREAGRIAC